MSYIHPEYLVEIDELADIINNDDLRVFDTSVILKPRDDNYEMISGHQDYLQGHIPGAAFIDLANHWADTNSDLRFTLPNLDDLQAAIGQSGISADDRVVLYSSGHLMWATRAWWLLHHAGHQNIAVLNGNLRAWQTAGHSLEKGQVDYPKTVFTASPRPNVFASTDEVVAGMHGSVCTLNALSRELYEGTGDLYYQRRGHIPGSRLMSFSSFLDNEYFLSADQLRKILEAEQAVNADRVITYCGGGIAATLSAFACALMGQDNVAVYDGSMSEWVQDDARPLKVGAAP